MPNLYLIAGCNGAGKTTASYAIFPQMLDCKEFVNLDEIAKGISPFHPESASIAAGRVVVERINALVKQGADFAVETTLATKSYVSFIKKAKAAGYFVTLVYFWLNSPELARKRVELRVRYGGHYVADEVVYRRYWAGMKNLFRMYIPISDYWILIDNSVDPFEIIAEGNKTTIKGINNEEKFYYLREYSYGR